MTSFEPEPAREESLYLDGELSPEARRRFETRLAGDPALQRRIQRWRENADLWRDDVRRAVADIDPGLLAERVLARAERSSSSDTRIAWRYAAAALVLLGLGVTGASVLGPRPGTASLLETGAAIRVLESERLAHQGRVEWDMTQFAAMKGR